MVAELEQLLARRLGLPRGCAAVEPGGREGEIAVVRVPADAVGRLLRSGLREELVGRARAAGFRHAALDLELSGGADVPPGDA